MPLEYKNRKGQKYYLHVSATKTGKPKYYFAQNTDGSLAEGIPSGFEIYENPNSQVFLRKIVPQLISDEEQEIVQREARRLTALKDCRLERKATILTVYTVDRPAQVLDEFRAMLAYSRLTDVEERLNQFRTYSANMRFILIDAEQRIFQTQRFCYRGSIDDWIDIGSAGTLSVLSKQYLQHLGQDSFYELY